VKQVIQREEARAGRGLEIARRVLSGRRLCIVADTPLAVGLSSLAEELGLETVLVVLLDRSLDGRPGGKKIVRDPTLSDLRELAARTPFDLAIRPSLALEGTVWEAVPTVECGFPASRKHFIYPLPELGYTGAVAMAQRLMDAARAVH
jgi:nitrogenase molybdenum-iron protein alpha/beta subunit